MEILQEIHRIIWGVPMFSAILLYGIVLTVVTGFAQFRLLLPSLKKLSSFFHGRDHSSRRALCTALSATVGIGNIAGVAGAICLGGPGTVFWMWVCGLCGMVIKFAEATLATSFHRREGGLTYGGPMYLIADQMPRKWGFFAFFYAFFGVAASFGVGNAAQINAVAVSLHDTLLYAGFTPGYFFYPLCGVVLGIVVYCIFRQGTHGITDAAQVLLPLAAAVYIVLSCIVLFLCRRNIPSALRAIFTGAFRPAAVTSGVVTSFFTTARIGISRGIFSSEAGMGTAAMAHAEAEVAHPCDQGLMGILEVFIDTMVICTMTALVILVSGIAVPYGTDPGAALTGSAFSSVCGGYVQVLFSLIVCLFAFATVLGWGFYGARCGQFLFGRDIWRLYPVLQGVTVFFGAALHTRTVWLLCEIVNGLMAIPNLVVLCYLTPQLKRLAADYYQHQKSLRTG